MKYVVVLMVILLAGGAGWLLGSRSGADAREALARAQELGKQVQHAHEQETTSLKQQLAKIKADFDQGQQAREAQHAQSKQALDAALAGRDKTIADLNRSVARQQARLTFLQQQLNNPSLPMAERATLKGEVDRLNDELQQERQRVQGVQCSKVPVPDELLQPLRLGT